MYPACEMDEYASRRFKFDCVIAAIFPTVIVSTLTAAMIASHSARNGPLPLMNTRSILANEAAFTATDMKAVIDVGAPSYASGVHWWNGTAAILKNIPADNVINAITDIGSAPRRVSASAITTKRVDPDSPYNSDIP